MLLRTINKPKSFREADANKRAIHRRAEEGAVSRLANLFRDATASLAPNHRRESSQNHYEIHRRIAHGTSGGRAINHGDCIDAARLEGETKIKIIVERLINRPGDDLRLMDGPKTRRATGERDPDRISAFAEKKR